LRLRSWLIDGIGCASLERRPRASFHPLALRRRHPERPERRITRWERVLESLVDPILDVVTILGFHWMTPNRKKSMRRARVGSHRTD
jgi:hypothetical protein